jgi:signal transduction histidine kinase
MKKCLSFIQKFWVRDNTIKTQTYQLYCVISIITYSLWGLFFTHLNANFKDGFWERFIVLSVLGLPIISTNLFKLKNKTVDLFFTLFFTGGVIHFFYLTYINDLHPIYITGSVLCTTAVQLLINNFRSFFIITTATLAFVIVIILHAPGPYSLFWLLSILTITLYSILALMIRLIQSEKLLDSTDVIKEQYLELERRTRQVIQSEKMAALGEMAAGIAHEINNPLSIISGNALIIAKGGLSSDENKDRLEKIQITTLRIAKIVSGLRTYARSGDDDPFFKVNFKQLFEETIELTTIRFNSNKIPFKIAPIPDVKISCRATQISQVLINLINNAFDAINLTPNKWLNISFKQSNKSIDILITDSGEKINSRIREKIFEPFFTTKDIGHGTGLGLSISKSIIEMHGGELFLDKLGAHTTFVVRIPVIS